MIMVGINRELGLLACFRFLLLSFLPGFGLLRHTVKQLSRPVVSVSYWHVVSFGSDVLDHVGPPYLMRDSLEPFLFL